MEGAEECGRLLVCVYKTIEAKELRGPHGPVRASFVLKEGGRVSWNWVLEGMEFSNDWGRDWSLLTDHFSSKNLLHLHIWLPWKHVFYVLAVPPLPGLSGRQSTYGSQSRGCQSSMVIHPEKVSWHCVTQRVAYLSRGEMRSALQLSQSQSSKVMFNMFTWELRTREPAGWERRWRIYKERNSFSPMHRCLFTGNCFSSGFQWSCPCIRWWIVCLCIKWWVVLSLSSLARTVNRIKFWKEARKPGMEICLGQVAKWNWTPNGMGMQESSCF